jgi:hypothetical protein
VLEICFFLFSDADAVYGVSVVGLYRLQRLPQTLPRAQNEEGTGTITAPAVGANDAAKCGRRSPHAHTQGN